MDLFPRWMQNSVTIVVNLIIPAFVVALFFITCMPWLSLALL